MCGNAINMVGWHQIRWLPTGKRTFLEVGESSGEVLANRWSRKHPEDSESNSFINSGHLPHSWHSSRPGETFLACDFSHEGEVRCEWVPGFPSCARCCQRSPLNVGLIRELQSAAHVGEGSHGSGVARALGGHQRNKGPTNHSSVSRKTIWTTGYCLKKQSTYYWSPRRRRRRKCPKAI